MTQGLCSAADATRALARDLLYAALALQAVPVSPPPMPVETPHPNGRPVRWTRATILQAIQAYVAREGRSPADPEFRAAAANDLPARMSLIKFWPSLSAAVLEAGFRPVPSRRRPRPGRAPKRPSLLLVLCLSVALLTGCTGVASLAETLNAREVTSCLFWEGHASAYLSVKGVTATGGATLEDCRTLR